MRYLYLEKFGNVHALPVLHYRMEFAHLVRQAVEEVNPDCIALELPATLKEQFLRGVRRLPELSVLRYQAGGETVFLMIEPADPLVEGGRLAVERETALHLVDIDVDRYPQHPEAFPDSYAIRRIGLKPFYRQYLSRPPGEDPDPLDLRREQGMSYRLQQLSARHERVLFICGMYHLERVRSFFSQPLAQPLTKTRREGVALFNLHPETCHEVLAEHPFLSAVYELRRGGLPHPPADSPHTLRRSFRALELIAGGKLEIPEEAVLREALTRSALLVGGEGEMPDRQHALLRLFQEAARHYRQETGESVKLWQRRSFFRFSRNYALLSGMLLPDLFQMLCSARNCVDDNFAYAFFRLAACYPWQKETSDLPTLRLTAAELWSSSRTMRFRKKEPHRVKGRAWASLQRKGEKRPGDWLEGFDEAGICSYPPEDITVEQYGRSLKALGARQLTEEHSVSEPFTVSFLDGIDMRETLRNFHEGRIYVKENRRVRCAVGSVVLIFRDERSSERFPYCMTWLGEHEQESDMAFYATSPADHIVGPGISRCEYGGFLLSYPPRRMLDVWGDPDYRLALSKAEVLLMAAVDYSPEKDIIYAAPTPPRGYLKQFASRLGKRIIYLPISSLSPVSLKKLRVFHVLFGHDKRAIAKDYVW